MTISQNLFRRHRGGSTRAETSVDETQEENDSSTNNNNSNGEAPSTVNNNIVQGGATSAVMNSSDNISSDVENPLTETNNNNNNDSENDDEIQELVIHTNSTNNDTNEATIQFPNWTLNQEEINTRRNTIRTEIERIQRSNFIHFLVLCLVPTSLLLIVIAAILSEDGECEVAADGLTVCEREPRTFVNAFTTRCICEAVGGVLVTREEDENL